MKRNSDVLKSSRQFIIIEMVNSDDCEIRDISTAPRVTSPSPFVILADSGSQKDLDGRYEVVLFDILLRNS